jgi:hypothetical protein
MLNTADRQGRIVLSGDVSGFDASLIPRFIRDVGYAVAQWFRGDAVGLWKTLVDNLVYNTALVTPSKFYLSGPSSMKSGSSLTNVLGTLCNMAAHFYGEEVGFIKLSAMCVLGDDFVLDGEGCTPDALSKYMSHLNLTSNASKQFFTKDALHYLQRLHIRGRPGGMASVMRTLGHTLGYERLQYKPSEWSAYAAIVRALSQVHNCEFNPFFLALVDTLKEGDKYGLGAELSPEELLQKAGTPGEEILKVHEVASWKKGGKHSSFPNWLVIGVLRGEEPPPGGNALFTRVYGITAV